LLRSRQCDYLLQQVAAAPIQIHVVPASAGSHAGLAGPFILAKGPDFEAAHLDTPWQAQITDSREAVDTLIARWEALRGEALPTSQTIDLIKDVARSWQT
jgi:hypothetical protein